MLQDLILLYLRFKSCFHLSCRLQNHYATACLLKGTGRKILPSTAAKKEVDPFCDNKGSFMVGLTLSSYST